VTENVELLCSIARNPDDDTVRLAYADWLDEHEQSARAEFIRAQVQVANLKEDSPLRRQFAFRCRQLLDAHEEMWLIPRDEFEFDWHWSRGFVDSFTTSPVDLRHTDAKLFDTYPFRRLWVKKLGGKADGLQHIPTDNRITALDLIGNKLSVNSLKRLAKFAHFPHLTELGLMFNDLRDTAVKVLCGEAFFQRLSLIRLGANPFTPSARDQLRGHFGDRVTFAYDRETERLYKIQDDYLLVGRGKDFTQFLLLAGTQRQRLAVFDHAGNLLRTEERTVAGVGIGSYTEQETKREQIRDGWLDELGYQSSTILVKRFTFPDGVGITPFNWWAEAYDTLGHPQRSGLDSSVHRWLAEGKWRFNYGGSDAWFDRTGEVTDT
jgi:uncharacterized protein (TIGR02996 family)